MSRESRKHEHIELALKTGQSGLTGLDDIRFVHQSLPDSSLSEVKTSTRIGGLFLSSPIFINAMTGGAADTYQVNHDLSIVARETGLAMAVGSQMAAIKNPQLRETYQIVRKNNPQGIIFANLGGEARVEETKQAIEMLHANAIQIHLNVMQELIMPEGDRHFKGRLERIADIAQQMDVPVIVKEVGFGISMETLKQLMSTGIAAIDVGGSGGTNFAKIENLRRKNKHLPLDILEEWGITTAQSLLEVTAVNSNLSIIGSGGIKNGLDVAKVIALGADAVGMAGIFLKKIKTSNIKEAIQLVNDLHEQLSIIMTALGCKNIYQLQNVPLVIGGDTFHWAEMRGINCRHFAQR